MTNPLQRPILIIFKPDATMLCTKLLLVLLCVLGGALSYRSINLDGFSSGTLPVPYNAAWSNLQDIMVEARVHDYDASPNEYKNVFNVFGFSLRTYGNQFLLQNDKDKIPDGLGTGVFIDVSKRPSDVLIRFGRSGDTFFAEMWNTATAGDYATKTLPIQEIRSNFTNPQAFLSSITAKIAWIKFSSSSTRGATLPPSPLQTTNVLASWNFEDNANDSGSQQINFVIDAVTPTYSDTPSYSPLASIVTVGSPYWAPAISKRVGSTVQLDGSYSYPLGNEKPLSYAWSQKDGPTTLSLSSSSNPTTSFVPAAFGTYTLILTVTETDTGATSFAEVSIGAVKTDSNGVVIPEDPNVLSVFGPLIIWGESPWPWLDERNYAMIEQFLWHFENNPNFKGDDFTNSLPGTISVTKSSKIVTGTGTDFQNTFCDGSTTPVRPIIIWYKYDDTTGRRYYYLVSCDSPTQLTLDSEYVATESQSDLQYSTWICAGCWIGGSTNINYYDNMISLYSFYYRTGVDRYLQKARELAVKWAKSPVIDGGRLWITDGGEVPKRCNPRVAAMLGTTWSAYEQNDEFLWKTVMNYNSPFGNNFYLFDIRENGYELGYLSISALLAPNKTYANECWTKVNASIYERWLPARNSDGLWELLTYGYAPWNGYTGTASVTKGSTQVIGSGTNWQSAWAVNNVFWISGDPITYVNPVVVSPTEITLSKPYEGESASGKEWQLNNICGPVILPYQIGLAGQMFYLAYKATNDQNVRDLVMTSADWIMEKGIQKSTRGLYYGRGGPTCEPISDTTPGCAFGNDTQSIWGARFLNGEVFGLLSRAMVLEPNNNDIRMTGDFLMAASLGKMGGPGTDDFWAEELSEFTITNSTKFKNVGFFFGTGFSPSWPAARLGPAAPSSNNGPNSNSPKAGGVASIASRVSDMIMPYIMLLVMSLVLFA